MNIILKPFVWLLLAFYNLFDSYGLALIFFALVVKVILFPFSLKGKRGMIQMNMLNGKIQKLQTQYGKDKERYNMEVQKLYEKEKVNPMGGCLWTMLPLLVLFPLYAIIRQPLSYMMDLSADQVSVLITTLNTYLPQAVNQTTAYFQLEASDALFQNFSSVVAHPAVKEFAANLMPIDFSFFGLNLAAFPNWKVWQGPFDWATLGLFLLPVISAVSGLFFSKISMKTNEVNQQSAAANSSNKMMMWMSPIMSLWIGFVMPAGLCIYWIANNVFSMLQEYVSGKMLKKDYAAAAAAAALREAEEKEEEKRLKKEAAEERARRLEDEKKNRGKKKPAQKEALAPGVSKEASREGIRAYARGRAYDPNRFGQVTDQPGETEPEPAALAAAPQTPSMTIEGAALKDTDIQDAEIVETPAATDDAAYYEPEAAPETEEAPQAEAAPQTEAAPKTGAAPKTDDPTKKDQQ